MNLARPSLLRLRRRKRARKLGRPVRLPLRSVTCYARGRKGLQRRKVLAMQPVLAALVAASSTKGKPQCRTRGPYQDRDRWRLTFIEGDKSWSQIFDTRAAALSAQRAFERRHAEKEALTVAHLVAQHLEHHVAKGTQPRSLRNLGERFRMFFGYTELLDVPVSRLTPEVARAAYEAYSRREKVKGGGFIAAATHQEDLKFARQLFEWAVEEKLATANPFAGVRPIGRVNKGKPQLSRDQATRFLSVADVLISRSGDIIALAAAVIVGTGARSSEVIYRRTRDLDEEGTLLRVKKGKTDRSNRGLRVPTMYVPYVAALAAGRPADALLFLPANELGDTEPSLKAMQTRLLRKVKTICKLAGVDEVVVHSFRGLYATLGVSTTGDPDLIARQLGHASSRVTSTNYIDHSVAGMAQQTRVQAKLGLLQSGPPLQAELPPGNPAELLKSLADRLDVAQLQEVMQHLLTNITGKAASARSTPKRDRSRSNTEQVGGSLRNLSARPTFSALSDGE